MKRILLSLVLASALTGFVRSDASAACETAWNNFEMTEMIYSWAQYIPFIGDLAWRNMMKAGDAMIECSVSHNEWYY